MADPEFTHNNHHYNLNLPPIAEPRPEDEPAVHYLADPDIRAGLGVVNDSVSAQLDQLQHDGYVVHELVRGTTADGLGIAVARYAEAGTPEAAAFETAQPRKRILAGDAPSVVFMYPLNDLTPEGGPRADEPWDLLAVPASRFGLSLGIATHGGSRHMELYIPASSVEETTLNRHEIVGFREAALGKRRVAAIEKSLDWIGAMALTARREERDMGAHAWLHEYKKARFNEIANHPEWVDNPPAREQLLPGLEEYLGNHPETLPYPSKDIAQHADDMRYGAANYARKHNLIDPEEIAVVARVMMPGTVIIDPPEGMTIQSPEYLDSYYKRGADYAGGRDGVVRRALEKHRAAKMAAM